MRCYECDGEMVSVSTYTWTDPCLGELSIPCAEGECFICACGEVLVSSSLGRRIDNEEKARTAQLSGGRCN